MRRLSTILALAVLGTLVGWAPAQARTCPPASIGGPKVAVISVQGKNTPVKRITYRNGGPLDPPHTNQAAGISARNASLHAKRGVTVITWHVRYGPGCDGTLNALTTMPIGSTFTVAAVGKPAATYRIASRETVRKGVIKASWFSHRGRHRLVMITCNDLTGGYFRRTMAILATPAPTPPAPVVEPVPAPPTVPTPTPSGPAQAVLDHP